MKTKDNKSDHPTVSIIIPVYNRENYIRECLTSVLADDYPQKEIIVIDDGSTDNTSEILDEYSGIKIIKQENRGVSIARNEGIKASTGEFITYLDSDDIWLPGRIEPSLGYFRSNPGIDYVLGQQILFLEDEIQCPKHIEREALEKPTDATNNGCLILRKSCYQKIGLFNTKYKKGEDTEWFFRAEYHGLKMARLPQAFFRRRIHQTNLSMELPEKNLENLFQILRESVQRNKA